MNGSRWTGFARRSALAGMLTVATLGLSAQTSVWAADDDDDSGGIWNLDKKIFDGIAKGIGLKSPNDPTIDYRERSPLVVPPSRNLPPPEAAGAGRTAAWPVDPDKKRRDESAKRKKAAKNSYDEDYQMRNLTPSELNPAGTRPGPTSSGGNMEADGRNYQPSELGYFGGLFSWGSLWGGGQKEEVGTFNREPPRSSLTEPPIGYQTPSQGQPYGVSKDKTRSKVTPLDPAVGSLGN